MFTPLIPAVFSILTPPPQQESTLKLLKTVIVFGYFLITSLMIMSFVISAFSIKIISPKNILFMNLIEYAIILYKTFS